MFEETFAYGVNPYDTIRRLSLETIEPLATSKAMHCNAQLMDIKCKIK